MKAKYIAAFSETDVQGNLQFGFSNVIFTFN